MIVYQSRFLTRGEVWFDNDPTSEGVDWVLYHQRSQPGRKGNWRPFFTRIIELAQPSESILGQMDGFTAADIKRAERKDLTICKQIHAGDTKALSEFCDFYDRFAAIKNLNPADRHWLERTAQAGMLDLWTAESPEGDRHAYHVFYRDARRVRSLMAASFYAEASTKEAQRKIGRANRLLIWKCMLHYRDAGAQMFDLGGWYNGTTDTARLGINKFKEGFGGRVVREFEGEYFRTMKARAAVFTARLLTKWKERGRRQEIAATLNPA